MTSAIRRTTTALLAAALGTGAFGAMADPSLAAEPAKSPAEPTIADLQQKIQELQKQVDAMQSKQQLGFDCRDVDAAVREVLKDAHQRSQLLSDDRPFTGGWKGGRFIIQDEQGNNVLVPSFQFQPRYIVSYRDRGDNPNGSDFENGFEIRRMKVDFAGNVINPNLQYEFQWNFNRSTGALALEDAWARYRFAEDWTVRAGQFKDPLSHEQIVSSRRFMAADRSYLNEVFIVGDNYVQGISLGYGKGNNPLQAEIAFTDGIRTANTDFRDNVAAPNQTDTRPEFGVAGRVQYKAAGDWKQYDDFSGIGNDKSLLVVAVGADFTQTGDTDVILHTADAQFETTTGLGLYGAAVGRYTMIGTVAAGAPDNFYDYGFLVQVGQMLDARHLEVFGRYDWLFLDAPSDSAQEITVGLNYFFAGHAAKLTLDASYLPDGAPVGAEAVGIIATDEEEIVVRIQFQLLI